MHDLWRIISASTVVFVLDSYAVTGELLQGKQAKYEGFVFMIMLIFLPPRLSIIAGINTLLLFSSYVIYYL